MSTDPVSVGQDRQNPQTWNRYSYVQNKPKDLSDPLGLCGCSNEQMFFIDDLIGWGDPEGLGTLLELECMLDVVAAPLSSGGGGDQSFISFTNAAYGIESEGFSAVPPNYYASLQLDEKACKDGSQFKVSVGYNTNPSDLLVGVASASCGGGFTLDNYNSAGKSGFDLSIIRSAKGGLSGSCTIKLTGQDPKGAVLSATGQVALKCPKKS